ncbi:MAG: hypothetical protein VW378_03180 [bacterium]
MIHKKEQLLQYLDQLPKRYKVLLVVTIISLSSYVMYLLILSPYLTNYVAIKNELSAHQNLLNSKALRTQAIKQLSDAKSEYDNILKKTNESFFSESEADLFIKTLPRIIKGFNNTVISIKPIQKDHKTIRHILLLDWVKSLPAHEQGHSIDYIMAHEADINAGVQTSLHIREISKRIINHNHEEVRRVWMRGKDDKLASYFMESIQLQLKMNGPYSGFLYVLQWLNGHGKLYQINSIENKVKKNNPNIIHTEMELSIYIIKEVSV